MEKIISNRELQELISKHLRDDDDETIAARKTVYIGAGKLLASIKMDMEAADKMGKKYFKRTQEFLEE